MPPTLRLTLALFVLVIAGCGGSGSRANLVQPAPALPSPSATPVPVPTPSPTPSPTPQLADAFVYAVIENSGPHGEFGPNTLQGWSVRDEQLSPIGNPVGSLIQSVGEELIAVSPHNKMLYVIGRDETSRCHIHSFSIQADGTLQEAGPIFKLGLTFAPMVFDPSGTFMFVTSDDGLHEFKIDPATEALTEIADSPFDVGGAFFARGAVMTNSGNFLYVTGSQEIWGYRFDSSSGQLTGLPNNPMIAGIFMQTANMDPGGSFVLVNDGMTGTVRSYSIDSTGQLQLQSDLPEPYGSFLLSSSFDLSGVLYLPSFNNNLNAPELPFARVDTISGIPLLAADSPISLPEPCGDGLHMVMASVVRPADHSLVVGTLFNLYILHLQADGTPDLPPLSQILATDCVFGSINGLAVTH